MNFIKHSRNIRLLITLFFIIVLQSRTYAQDSKALVFTHSINTNSITLEFKGNSTSYDIKCSQIGKDITSYTSNSSTYTLSDLTPGSYWVTITDKDNNVGFLRFEIK